MGRSWRRIYRGRSGWRRGRGRQRRWVNSFGTQVQVNPYRAAPVKLIVPTRVNFVAVQWAQPQPVPAIPLHADC